MYDAQLPRLFETCLETRGLSVPRDQNGNPQAFDAREAPRTLLLETWGAFCELAVIDLRPLYAPELGGHGDDEPFSDWLTFKLPFLAFREETSRL